MKRLVLAALVAAFSYPALAQVADQDHVWATPGNATVGGIVTLCQNASGKAVPCSSSGGTATNVVIQPTSTASAGITPVVSSSAENNHVLKNAAGNLYSVYAVNQTSTPGLLMVFNATTAPADGAVTPLACTPLSANGVASINNKSGPPQVYGTGITAVVSSGTNCFNKTTGTVTAFFSGDVQ